MKYSKECITIGLKLCVVGVCNCRRSRHIVAAGQVGHDAKRRNELSILEYNQPGSTESIKAKYAVFCTNFFFTELVFFYFAAAATLAPR
jgi:hypothetical protein